MTTGTECPHCESVFQVDVGLVAKPMRCPNPDCREVFTVAPPPTAVSAAPPPAPAAPVPVPEGGSVADYMPVYEAEAVAPPPTAYEEYTPAPPVYEEYVPPRPRLPPPPVRKATPRVPPPPAARAPEVIDYLGEGPKKPRSAKPRADAAVPLRSRPRRGKWGGVVLFGLLALLVAVGGGSVWLFFANTVRGEEQEAAEAETQYKEGRYAEAKKRYEGLAKDRPDSPQRDRYRFMAGLATAQAAVGTAGLKDDPAAGRRAFDAFLTEFGDSTFAQPTTWYGADVVLAGKKLGTAFADHATDLTKKFQADRGKPALLDAAATAVADGRAVLPALEKFRDKGGLSFDDERKKLDDAEGGVTKERERLAALAPWRKLAADPTDDRIDDFERAMKAAGLDRDAEAAGLVTTAKAELRRLVVFVKDEAPPEPPPAEPGPVYAAVCRVAGTPDARDPRGGTVAFGIARGVLYAVNARTGAALWHQRIQSDPQPADPPLRVTLPDGATEWVLVPSVRGGRAALTARRALTGEAEWHLPLPAPVLAAPVAVGMRLYVPLADARGTILAVGLDSGEQLGKVELRQPIGGGITAVRGENSGHAFLIVPGDARRVFVFEAGRQGADGKRQPPQVVRVFATAHPRGSLRGPPVLIPAARPDAPRRILLAQTDGPKSMKLRAFALPADADLAAPSADADAPPQSLAEVGVNGWGWFPPLTDGERIAVATDTGDFAAFGLNLPGSADKPLYALPGTPPDPAAVSRSQVAHMDESGYWVILGGKLTRLLVASDPRTGQRLAPQPNPVPLGEPVSAAQGVPGDTLKVVTVKQAETGIVHLVAFDTATGDVKWKRQLGAAAACPPIRQADGTFLHIDTAGGVYRLDADDPLSLVEKCEPRERPTQPAKAATAGGRVWVFVHEAGGLTVRVVANGKLESERTVNVPAAPAGNALAVGDVVLLPLANGFIQRIGAKGDGDGTPLAWRAGMKADAGCHLSAGPDDTFYATDGGTQLTRRRWPAGKADAEKAGGPWELVAPAVGPAATVSANGKEWVLVADAGGVSAYDPAKPSTDPVRRWAGGDLSAGKAGMLTASGGRAVWVIDGKTVASADPAADKPAWVYTLPADAGEVMGLTPTTDGGVLAATSAGGVIELNGKGEVTAEAVPLPTSPPAATAAARTGEAAVLLPHTDGTVSRLTMRKK